MRPFEYASPKTREQVVAMLGPDSAILAGGTDLLALIKDDVVTPKRLINVKDLGGTFSGINFGGPTTQIGALVTLDKLAAHPQIRQAFPMLHEAALEAASPQIRNVATLGGNICQRPRCWYFRNGMGLLPKDANGESLILKGDNRYHAILVNDGPAYFVSPSTVVPVLIAYSANISLFGPSGAREIPIEKFFVIPKAENEREHDLRPNEMVTQVSLPTAQGVKTGYHEVRQKEAFDWPYTTCAVALTMSGNTVSDARIVLGHVAPIPWISEEAAQAIIGKAITADTAMAAANAALAPAKPLSMNKHKITLAKVAVKRALLNAAGVKGA